MQPRSISTLKPMLAQYTEVLLEDLVETSTVGTISIIDETPISHHPISHDGGNRQVEPLIVPLVRIPMRNITSPMKCRRYKLGETASYGWKIRFVQDDDAPTRRYEKLRVGSHIRNSSYMIY